MEKTIEVSIPLTFSFTLRADYENLLNQINQCLIKTVKPKLESSTFRYTQLKWGLQKTQGALENIV
jgi:hypothetical protein